MQITSRVHNSLACSLATATAAFAALSASCASYPDAVASDAPLAYYRFNDLLVRNNVNANSGSLGAAANATNTFNLHMYPGALAGDGDQSQFFDSTAWGMIPYQAALNPDNTKPFTVEAWLYPASDQINGGQCPLNNRLAGSATDRSGWVLFQRAPSDTYSTQGGYEGVGWDFRMYRGSGSSSGLDVISQVPYEVGKWTHMAVVYDPVDPVTNATLTIYINGVAANTNVWTGGSDGASPGYVANAADSDVALSLGAYNNTSGAGGNPYFGGIDEFAFYAAKLTPDQILAHYQNGTNASRTTPYAVMIHSNSPVAYLRLDEPSPDTNVVLNLGDLRKAGVATNSAMVIHSSRSALAGRTDDGSYSGHLRNGGGSFADIPWLVENNPDASVPFTFESWFRPLNDQMSPGPCPVNNRLANGIADRTGWVIYQRDPNDSYSGVSGSEGTGWDFRMYTGTGSSAQDVVTGVPYVLGEWQHLVVTWEPQTSNGATPSGSEQWQGVLTAYVNGLAVASNTAALYAANSSTTEDGRTPADLSIGSYNLASGGGEPFEGNIDEVAFYNNYVLTPAQILAHYQTGTNAHPATNYETLVLTAAYNGDPATPQRTMPKTYLRFNEPAFYPAANSGSLGFTAQGSLVLATNLIAGPATAGFEASNTGVSLDGTNGWISLNDPAGLDLAGQITLEAWIQPAATQGNLARIISHGPPTPTVYDLTANALTLSGSLLDSDEVFLRIEGSTNYAIGTSDGTNFYGVSAPVGSDLGGGKWIYLAGTYDGTAWLLYRNGAQIASATNTVGALTVTNTDWAIGATGNGWADFFTGAIDEVAIYKKALTASQIQAHYAASVGTTPRLSITASNGSISLTWTSGTLQQADAVTGPFNDVGGATSPYTTPTSATQKFYRLKL